MAACSSKRYLAEVILLTALILGSSLGFALVNILNTPAPNILYQRAKVTLGLKVDVYDSSGNLKASRSLPDDLLTKQFIDFQAAFFMGGASGATADFTAKNDANTDKTFRVFSATSAVTNTICDASTGTAAKGGFIGIGTGTTAPARTDYHLETKVEAYTGMAAAPVWDTVSGNVTMSANVAITGSRTISEAALGVYWIDTSGTLQNVIMSHDTFSGISVVNTDVCAVSYTFHFNSVNFLNNYGLFLSAVFTSVADGSSKSVSMKDDTNVSDNWFQYGTAYANYAYYRSSTAVNLVEIGTSNTAVARTQYAASTPTESNTAWAIVTDSTGFTITSSTVCNSAKTIHEVVYYIQTNEDNYAFIRVLTGGDAVASGNIFIAKLRVDM